MNYEVRLLPKDFTLSALNEEIDNAIMISGKRDLILLVSMEQMFVLRSILRDIAGGFTYSRAEPKITDIMYRNMPVYLKGTI